MAESFGKYQWYAHRGGSGLYAARVIYEPTTLVKTLVLMHREVIGAEGPRHVDHINGDQLDNRLMNLRMATESENQSNRGISQVNTSGYKCVAWHRRHEKWIAHIRHQGKPIHLGYFTDPIEAALAVDARVRELRGEFGRYNFPRPGERPARD